MMNEHQEHDEVGIDPSPDLDAVNQEQADCMPVPPVPVATVGPVQVQTLPVRTTSMRNIPLDGVETICAHDPRRATVLVCATAGTAAFFIGNDRQMVESGQSARFNTAQQVLLRTSDRLYARSATPGTVCQLSIIIDNWAD